MVGGSAPFPRPQKGTVTSTTPPVRRFSTEIQALRALAVTLVVLFHVFPERLRGGYVGVDVFFVISGFLITSHLWRERVKTGSVDLLAFWARRIRRLLPAAALVLIVALVATLPFVPIQRYPAILQEFWSSIGLVENWTLALTSVNYFDAGRAASPFQHYWSLSVEEQFYLVWPVILVVVTWLVSRFARTSGAAAVPARRSTANPEAGTSEATIPAPAAAPVGGTRVYVILIAAIGLASFVFSVVSTAQNRDIAYFSTLTHVWEFTAGALLSFAAPRLGRFLWNLPAGLRQAVGGVALVAGVALILLSAVAYTGSTPFPGWRAAVPTLGAFLVIMTSIGELPRPLAAFVAWRPVDFLGAISYSLYLWHWPVLTVVGLTVAVPHRLKIDVFVIVVSVVLAWLTKRFVEDPARTIHHPRRATLRTYVLGAAVVVIALAVSIAPQLNFTSQKAQAVAAYQTLNGQAASGGTSCVGAGAPLNPNPAACPNSHVVGAAEADLTPWLPILEADTTTKNADSITWGNCPSELANNLHTCSFGPADAAFHVEVVGDSHGFQWAHTVLPIAKSHGWRVTVDWHSGCPLSVPGYYTPGGTGDTEAGADCQTWEAQILKKVVNDKSIDVVVMSGFSHKYAATDQTGKLKGVQKANEVVMKQIADSGKKVVVMGDPPFPGRVIPTCIAASPTKDDPCSTPRDKAVLADPMADAAKALNDPDITLVDVTPLMCDQTTCHSVIGGITAYQDSHHLSSQFLDTLRPVLEPQLMKIAQAKA